MTSVLFEVFYRVFADIFVAFWKFLSRFEGFYRVLDRFDVALRMVGKLLRFLALLGVEKGRKRTVCRLRRRLFAFSRTLEVVRVFDNFGTF